MALTLYPEEALILFIRRSPADPPQYTVGIRACQTVFNEAKDLQPTNLQRSVCEGGEFPSLEEALDAAVERLRQVASGSMQI